MRLPIASDLKTRTGAPATKDARLQNCYAETKGDQSVVRKRPCARGGLSVGTGTAQGGIGIVINGVPYFVGFWADVSYTATMVSLNGTAWSSLTTYQIGDFYYEQNGSDPFSDPPTIYYALAISTNKPRSSYPTLWSTSPPVATRFTVFGSGYDGVVRNGYGDTLSVATDAWFSELTYTTCPGNPGSLTWIVGAPYTWGGGLVNGYAGGTGGVRPCGDPGNIFGPIAIASYTQTA